MQILWQLRAAGPRPAYSQPRLTAECNPPTNCHAQGLNYVSASPHRIPIAIVAAAQAAIEQTKNRYKEPAEEKISDGIDKISDSLKKLINEVTSIKRIYEKRDAKDNA